MEKQKQKFWYSMEFYDNIWIPDKFVFYTGETDPKVFVGNGVMEGPFSTFSAAKKDALKRISQCMCALKRVEILVNENIEIKSTIK